MGTATAVTTIVTEYDIHNFKNRNQIIQCDPKNREKKQIIPKSPINLLVCVVVRKRFLRRSAE